VERTRSVAGLLQRAGVAGRVRAVLFVGETSDAKFKDVEFVDLARLRGMVDRLRRGHPVDLCR